MSVSFSMIKWQQTCKQKHKKPRFSTFDLDFKCLIDHFELIGQDIDPNKEWNEK